MNVLLVALGLLWCLGCATDGQNAAAPALRPPAMDPDLPHLVKQGSTAQLLVNGKPLLMLGGELHNSSSSSLRYMEPLWSQLAARNLNTVIASASWELLEPQEGKFDFTLIDGLLAGARRENLHLVLIYFGAFKNAASNYAPAWVLANTQRFPRMEAHPGIPTATLSAISPAVLQADSRAFAALMQHLRQVDKPHTVVMMQVENECGIKGPPRDHAAAADQLFAGPVPAELLTYLQNRRANLRPEFRKAWDQAGGHAAGSWSEVFGENADEIFMAWTMGRYVGGVAAAGKAQYPLPMYANAWLVQDATQKAGAYPSGGPVAHVHDVWQAAAPALDFLSPDIYLPDIRGITAAYTHAGNPLFIPEIRPFYGPSCCWYAFGEYGALGFCPFGIDGVDEPTARSLSAAYLTLGHLAPLIRKYQNTGRMRGILFYPGEKTQDVDLGAYRLHVTSHQENAAGLVMALEDDTYLVAGAGFQVEVQSNPACPKRVNTLKIDEYVLRTTDYVQFSSLNISLNDHYEPMDYVAGTLKEGPWVRDRRLNGDEYRVNAGEAKLVVFKVYPF